jgi:hypothetical protein
MPDDDAHGMAAADRHPDPGPTRQAAGLAIIHRQIVERLAQPALECHPNNRCRLWQIR